MSTESVSQYDEPEEAPRHVVTCWTALKYYLCCYCCCSNRIAPLPSEDAIQSIGSGSITSDTFAQREREREQEVLKSLFKFSAAGKLGKFAAIEAAKKAAEARNKRRFKTAGIAGMVISSSVAASEANVRQTKGRKSFQDVGKMASLGVKTARKGKGNNESIEEIESSDDSEESSSDEEEETPKKKGWGLKSIGKLGFLGKSAPEKVKSRGKKTFKDAGKLTRVGVQASGKGKSQPRSRKSFKAVGKLTQMGVKSSKSAKEESSDDSEESSSDDDEETPKKKGWGLKSIGKLGFLRSSSPEKKRTKGKKTFKDAGKLTRVGVQASRKGKSQPRSRKSFKAVGKLTQMGVKSSKSAKEESSEDSEESSSDDEEETPKKKGWGLKSIGKLGFLRSSSPEKKPAKGKKTFKDAGKLTRVGVQASGKGRKHHKGKKTFKDAGKLTRVGVQASGRAKKKKRIDYVDETLVEEILNNNEAATTEEAVVEVRRRRTLKSVGKIIKLSAAAKEKRPKRKLFTFKSIGNFIRYGTRNSPRKGDPNESDSSEASPPPRKKKSFKVAGKLAKFGFGRNKVESFDDEERSPPARKKKSFKVAGKLAKFGFGRNKVESFDDEERSPPVRKRKSFKVAGKLAKFGFGRNKMYDSDEEEEKVRKRKGKHTGIMGLFRGSSPVKKKKGKKTFKDAGKLTRVGVQASGKAKKKRGIPLRQSFKMVSVKIKKVASLGTSISESFKKQLAPSDGVKKKPKKSLKSVAKVSMLGALVSKFSKSPAGAAKPKQSWTFRKLGRAAKVGAAVQTTAKRSKKPPKKKKFSLKFLSRFIGATQDDRKDKCTCIRDSINSDIMICTCSDYFDTDDEG